MGKGLGSASPVCEVSSRGSGGTGGGEAFACGRVTRFERVVIVLSSSLSKNPSSASRSSSELDQPSLWSTSARAFPA
jgi:hypothetical protein